MVFNKRSSRLVRVSILLYIAGGILRAMGYNGIVRPIRPSAVAFVLFSAICIIFMIGTRRRIPGEAGRAFMMMVLVLLTIWMAQDLCYEALVFLGDTSVAYRWVWYVSYLPIIFIPNVLLLAIVYSGYDTLGSRSSGWLFTLFVSLILLFGIFTNETHGLAFIIDDNVSYMVDYSYGPIYYITMGWCLLVMTAVSTLVFYRARNRKVKRQLWIGFLPIILQAVYILWWMLDRPIFRHFDDAFGVAHVTMAITLGSVETFMYTGLIRANQNDAGLISKTSINMAIEDRRGICFRTDSTLELDERDLEKARFRPRILDPDHVLHSKKMPGGRVYWVEDLTPINNLTRELALISDQLSQEVSLDQAESGMYMRAAAADEKSRLYTSLAKAVQPQIDAVDALLSGTTTKDKDFKEKLAKSCVYEVFIKRYINMRVLAEESGNIDVFELRSAVAESLSFLRITGSEGDLSCTGRGMYPAKVLLLALLAYEYMAETAMNEPKTFDIVIEANNSSLRVDIGAKGSAGANGEEASETVRIIKEVSAVYAYPGAKTSVDASDGQLSFSLFFYRDI